MNRNTAKLFLPIIIFILSFLVYLPSLGNSFVWDDQTLIERSYRYLKDVNYSQLFFPAPDAEKTKKYYRPIVRSSIAADYAVWELNSFGYHLTNNLLFSFTSVAFFFFILIYKNQNY